MTPIPDSVLWEIAEALDRLITIDISGRGVINVLYEAARKKASQPLTLTAANLLRKHIKPGDRVLIVTGWVDQPLAAPDFGETDGPLGALVLARALRLTLKAIPIILVDECLVEGMKKLALAAGFHTLDPKHLHHSVEHNKLLTTSVLSFPAEHDAARQASDTLLSQFNPAVCIAIERGGMNSAGMIHNMLGCETGAAMAKFDHLFLAAARQNIATIGIGDGGNELGMANIADTIRQHIPYAKQCQCPCGLGLVPSTPVDALLTSTISNWGGYAIAAMLAASTGILSAIHSPANEIRLLNAAVSAGFHDAIYGSVAPSVDGCIDEVQTSVVRIMQEIVQRRL